MQRCFCLAEWRIHDTPISPLGPSASQPAAKLGPGERVHHLLPLEPATPRLIDPIAHEAQMLDAMRVAIDGDLHPEFARPVQVHIIEVKPFRWASSSNATSHSLAA